MSTEKIPISVVILSHNEAINLKRCITALQGCDEVVVLDDGSTDESQQISVDAGARIIENPFVSFAAQRDWAMLHGELKHDWVFHLDADEVMTPESLEEIRQLISVMRSNQVGMIARKMMLDDCWLEHSADYPVYVPRLIHKLGPRYVMRGHGERIDTDEKNFVFLKQPMLHYVFSKGWPDWYARHERYAKAEADRIKNGLPAFVLSNLWADDRTLRRNTLRTLSYKMPLRPLLRFVYAYILKRGFLDGQPGYDFCRAMARYEGMIDQELKQRR